MKIDMFIYHLRVTYYTPDVTNISEKNNAVEFFFNKTIILYLSLSPIQDKSNTSCKKYL